MYGHLLCSKTSTNSSPVKVIEVVKKVSQLQELALKVLEAVRFNNYYNNQS